MKRPYRNIVVVVLALAIAFAAGWYLGRHSGKAELVASSATPERKVLYWHDPMAPSARFDQPGKSPYMDMDLVPVYADEGAGTAGGPPIVTVRPEILNSLGVRTAPTTRGKSGGLMVPREAVIRTGTRSSVVLALGEGRFRPVDVIAGTEVDDAIEITQGLKDGDRVVVSGQFLIDSEASTRATFRRMESPASDERKP